MKTTEEIEAVGDDAIEVVANFVDKHHAAAIPALIGACAMWAVENGALDLIKTTLANASRAADAMNDIRMSDAQ